MTIGQMIKQMIAINMTIEQMIAINPIRIIAGEGEAGTIAEYTGKRTMRAIKARLTRERSGGDRWARAEVHSHTTDWGCEIWFMVAEAKSHDK